MQQAHPHPAHPLIEPARPQCAPASSPHAWTQSPSPHPRPFALAHARPHVHASTPAAPRLQSRTQPRRTSPPMSPSHVARPTPSPHPVPMLARKRPACIQPHTHTLSHRARAPCLYTRTRPRAGQTARTRPAKSVHTLDRAMETLFEEGPAAAAKKAKGGRSNTIPGLEPLSLEHKPPKMPVRSLTGLSHVMFAEPTKGKECIRCEAVIEDGRWIQTDAGGARGAGRI
ncbi:hypothetical protein FIBSPDRAFT_1018057 [Athelia psychrophila]|uniref:Uncharacterized protein n=1 Tax=Athelia psychrophila TaxID=1759441 RepID=A0A166KWW7_9AGAM|nr:hypothetical protein FIBSPDRAFT_1018057 [Fibularhizoctonia sp. CBS 109695]